MFAYYEYLPLRFSLNSDGFILTHARVVGIVVGKWTNFEYYPFNQVHMGAYRFKLKSSLSVLIKVGRVYISSEKS